MVIIKNMKYRIFSHRGVKKENSLEGLKNSFSIGYRAIEFDIWYVDNQLILSHDRPKKPYKNYDNLKDFLGVFKNQLDYWLDFKNLNKRNSAEIFGKIKLILNQLKIDTFRLYFAPFLTDIESAKPVYKSIRKYFGDEARILAVCEFLSANDYSNYYRELKGTKVYGLSIEYTNINPQFVKFFTDIAIFAWTVNDLKIAKYLKEIGVGNITSDRIIPNQMGNEF